MRVYEDILELVGRTPLVKLRTGIPKDGPQAFAKLEFINPTGSLKDRLARHAIQKAFSEGRLKPGDTVVDNTSGNAGTSIAMVAAVLGLKAILTMPDKTSREKVDLMKAYGAEIHVTATDVAHDDPEGYYMVARRLAQENGFFDVNQYDSQDNIEAHYRTTGPEIWEDTAGRITHFVVGIGTGGTMSGAARFLKERNPRIKVIAVDPEGSIFADLVNGNPLPEPAVYKVEGIGTDVITGAFVKELIDEVITVSDRDSFERARLISRTEGICGGGSSGSVAVAMEKVAAGCTSDDVIVGIFADGGIRYLSKMYSDEWMAANGFTTEEEMVKTR